MYECMYIHYFVVLIYEGTNSTEPCTRYVCVFLLFFLIFFFSSYFFSAVILFASSYHSCCSLEVEMLSSLRFCNAFTPIFFIFIFLKALQNLCRFAIPRKQNLILLQRHRIVDRS